MVRRALRAGVPVSSAVLAVVALLAVVATVVPVPETAPRALLTVFTGAASVLAPGAPARVGRTGDRLADGDSVTTAADSKAALTYPDGSVTRLDSQTTVQVHIAAATGGGLVTDLTQTAGLTWNSVQRLVGGSGFTIRGPNQAVAGVRGTEFGYYVEHDPDGSPVIWIDTWSGSVEVSGGVGPAVTASTGQRVTVRANAAPTTPAPIPTGDRQLSFTVFNQALDALTGTPVAFANGTLSTGGTAPVDGVTADGRSDLQFVLAWPGSTYRLAVVDPAGAVAGLPTSSTPPLSFVVTSARAGHWTATVTDVQSAPGEAWWVIIGSAPHAR